MNRPWNEARGAILVLALAATALGCDTRTAPPSAPAKPLPPRYAWDGFGCTSDRAWSGDQDSFATAADCERAFVASCASRPTPRVHEIASGRHARIDGQIIYDIERMRLSPGLDSGFVRIGFITETPLDDEQRATLRCWGVIVGSSVGVVYFGAVSRKSLAAFVALPYVKQVDIQRNPVLVQ